MLYDTRPHFWLSIMCSIARDLMLLQIFDHRHDTPHHNLLTMSSRSVAKATDVLERWYNLLEQESAAYKTENYLTTPPQTANDVGSTFGTEVKIACRSKLLAWMYNLVDAYSLDRDLVAIAASYIDRYLAKHPPASNWGYMYQKVGMTSIYLAVKIHRDQGKCAGAASFAKLSRGLFTEHDLVKMESSMLNKLDWRMYPPTVHTFAAMLLKMVPRGACSPFSRHAMFERIRFLLELSIAVPFFLGKKPSNIAIGAFIEIMESKEKPNVPSFEDQAQFKHRLYIVTGIDFNSDEVIVCRDAMKKIHQESQVELKKDAAATTVTP